MRRFIYAAILAVVALAASGCRTSGAIRPPATAAPTNTPAAALTADDGTYLGDPVQPPYEVQDFALPASTGETLRLSDLNGRWRVLFFGYLHCPDYCPMTLAQYARVNDLLGDAADDVQFVFISVDGARDTPQALASYLNNFDESFIGFQGDDATLAQIQPDYGFYYRRNLDSGSGGYYTVDHSTRSYLIDPEGRLRATFVYNIPSAAMAEALIQYVNGTA